ncbi:uncharacterized protein E0L32_008695 [Thyridium curvatum]|uniref:Thiamine pyrophosphokinase n=1 Tax=Thyridium curvatum TaxID=1093900 RepID=A0A507B163_9PEZI|nr:uncharacterized protein E0L32_008695 [Thyridium curvatum]TPX10290.1 hypothetical protein E0L32_008695 [Thyridium curvatum]
MPSEQTGPIDWFPASLLQDDPEETGDPFALVVLNQPLRDLTTLKRLWNNATYRAAADGGANHLYQLRDRVLDSENNPNRLDVVIGDLDSLSDEARDYFSSLPSPTTVIHDPDQYSTDFTKAVRHIRTTQKPSSIVALGGLGGRVDQGLSQLHHLFLFQQDAEYSQGRFYLLSDESLTFVLKTGKHRIHVRGSSRQVFGKHVGIIPLRGKSIISTKGLEWDVTDWTTEIGGQLSTSNHILPETSVVEVETNNDVLFTVALLQR